MSIRPLYPSNLTEYFIDAWDEEETVSPELSPMGDSNRSADSLSSFTDLIHDEEKQQDLESLFLMNKQVDHDDERMHDEEVKQGMATFLIKLLHKTLRRADPGDADSLHVYRDNLERSCALRVSIICSALEMVLRCSRETTNEFVRSMPVETLPTLVILVEIFSGSQSGSRTVREVVLNKAASIFNRLCAHGIPIRIVVVEALFALLKGPTDTKIEAACALASLAARRSDKLHHCTLPKIEQISPSLIITLTFAASSLPEAHVEDILDALIHLTTSSAVILINIAGRIGTLRVLNQCMRSSLPEIRRNSYMIASSILGCNGGFQQLFAVHPLRGEIMLRGLATAALNEVEAEMQHFVTCLLTRTLSNMNGNLEHVEIITEALVVLSGAAIQDRTADEAALCLCRKAPCFERPSCQESVSIAISGLAQSSSRIVCIEALRALDKLSSRPTTARFLATQDSFQRAIASKLQSESNGDFCVAMSILKRLASEQQIREAICQSSIILDVLVDAVSTNKITNRIQHETAVELVLVLMSESTIKSFLIYSDLLPWLATLANSDTLTTRLKKDAVDAIVRLTSEFLED